MKYFSMFSGIGGFELGIEKVFYNQYATQKQQDRKGRDWYSDKFRNCLLLADNSTLCVGYSEIDKHAIQIYEKHFRGHKNYGDATKINPDLLPDFDLLVGGFPCQAFSIAGNRRGFEDTRGTLFFEIARVLERKQPRMFLLENVKGLLNHDEGNTFTKILQTIDELGYDAEWQVLNSKNFGVPQNRERVFIIGHLRGTSGRKIFPIFGFRMGKTNPAVCLTQRGYGSQRNGTYVTTYAKDFKIEQHHNNLKLIELTKNVSDTQRIYDPDGISKTLKSLGGGMGAKTGLYSVKERIRRLTPIECERLQGFPDNWTKGISDTQRYKCLGNAVTVNVIVAIISYWYKK